MQFRSAARTSHDVIVFTAILNHTEVKGTFCPLPIVTLKLPMTNHSASANQESFEFTKCSVPNEEGLEDA
jgi:hypothetical protein